MDQSGVALSLNVFGPPEVHVRETKVKFRSRKELALIVYLAMAGGRHTREKLTVLLWPESDRKLGAAALRNTLARARRALGNAEGYLDAEADLVRFGAGRPFELDAAVAQAAFQTVLDPRGRASDVSVLQRAISAYRGDFLDGFSLPDAPDFDDWASREREAWHQRLERIFNRLSRVQFEAGQVEQAIDTTRRWIEHSSLHEPAYRRLMQLHLLRGDRGGALHVFEECRRVLATELQVGPDSETLDLAERIRTSPMPSTVAARQKRVPLFPELPFVGRAAEHGLLAAAYEAASEGEPQVVGVFGEAGVGKTRLTQAFLHWAAVQDADILSGRASEAGGSLPYEPLISAVRRRLGEGDAAMALVGDTWLGELSQLLPELRDGLPHLAPSSNDPNLARSHLLEAFAQLGEALSRRGPVVLSIDDLQWADAATLATLRYASRRWTELRTRLLVVVVLRSEPFSTTPSPHEWLDSLARDVRFTRIHLQPLTAEATRQLAHGLSNPWEAQRRGAERFGDWLFAETGGQPYFVAETIKMLAELDILQTVAGHGGAHTVDFDATLSRIRSRGRLPVPASVREVITSRLKRLSGDGRALLSAGAALGRACGFEELCQVSGVDELAGLTGLDEALAGQLLVELVDTRRPYTFAHDKIREVVYESAGTARRQAYHRRAFGWLRTDGAPAAELAHHALLGGLSEPAYEYSVAAGDHAAGIYAYVEAAEHYRRAVDLLLSGLDDGGAVDVATLRGAADVYLRLGRALELASEHERALSTYEEMEKLASSRGDRAAELTAVLAQITPLVTVTAVFDPAEGERLAERGLQLAHDMRDERAEADALWNGLNLYRNTNRLPEAIDRGERALTLARRLEMHERTAFVLHDLGSCHAFAGHFETARSLFQEAGSLWRSFDNLPMLTDSYIGTCMVCVFGGDYDAAIACFEEALRLATATRMDWALAGCRHNVGYVFADRGDVDRALIEMEEGMRLSERAGFISPQIMVPSDRARLCGALGAPERGIDQARSAVSVARDKLPFLIVYPLAVLTQLCLIQGRLAEAEATVEQMQSDPNRGGLAIFPALILESQSRLALAQKRYGEALALAEQAAAAARGIGARPFLLAVLDLQGQASLGLGRHDLATQHWHAARVEAESMGSRLRLWPILLALSRLEPDRTSAARLRRQAGEVVTYIDARTPPDLRAIFRDMPEVRALLEAPCEEQHSAGG